MQRQILSDLLSAFSETKFIVSTHSPLVVGSVKDSSIYALRYNDQNKIVSDKLDFDKKAKTAAEILNEVLGVSVTMPIWAEKELRDIVNEYTKIEPTEDIFINLRKKLSDVGLENLMPIAIKETLEKLDD